MSDTAETHDDPWGAHASTYDRIFAPLTGYIARSMLAMVDTRLGADAQVLDIACGSGALFLPAVERAAHRRAAGGSDVVTGCDFSAGMVQTAQRHAGRYDSSAFRCEVQDGQALTYGDGSFDAAFSCFGIFLFADREAGWREAARVVEPGGLFATTTWMAPEHNEMFRAQFGPLFDALPARLKEDPTPPGWMVVADPTNLAAEVEQAGFVDVEVRPLHTPFVMPSSVVAWDCLLDNPGSGALLRECDAAEQQVISESFHRSMQDRAGGPNRPVVLEASCNVLTARRG